MMGKKKGSISKEPWPNFDEKMLVQEEVLVIAQVNGKLRGKFQVPVDADEAALQEIVLTDTKIQEFIGNKPIKKIIVVPNKIINIVV